MYPYIHELGLIHSSLHLSFNRMWMRIRLRTSLDMDKSQAVSNFIFS